MSIWLLRAMKPKKITSSLKLNYKIFPISTAQNLICQWTASGRNIAICEPSAHFPGFQYTWANTYENPMETAKKLYSFKFTALTLHGLSTYLCYQYRVDGQWQRWRTLRTVSSSLQRTTRPKQTDSSPDWHRVVGLVATTFVMIFIELILTFFGLTIVYLQLNLISKPFWFFSRTTTHQALGLLVLEGVWRWSHQVMYQYVVCECSPLGNWIARLFWRNCTWAAQFAEDKTQGRSSPQPVSLFAWLMRWLFDNSQTNLRRSSAWSGSDPHSVVRLLVPVAHLLHLRVVSLHTEWCRSSTTWSWTCTQWSSTGTTNRQTHSTRGRRGERREVRAARTTRR